MRLTVRARRWEKIKRSNETEQHRKWQVGELLKSARAEDGAREGSIQVSRDILILVLSMC